jgi:hypothetical protein
MLSPDINLLLSDRPMARRRMIVGEKYKHDCLLPSARERWPPRVTSVGSD